MSPLVSRILNRRGSVPLRNLPVERVETVYTPGPCVITTDDLKQIMGSIGIELRSVVYARHRTVVLVPFAGRKVDGESIRGLLRVVVVASGGQMEVFAEPIQTPENSPGMRLDASGAEKK